MSFGNRWHPGEPDSARRAINKLINREAKGLVVDDDDVMFLIAYGACYMNSKDNVSQEQMIEDATKYILQDKKRKAKIGWFDIISSLKSDRTSKTYESRKKRLFLRRNRKKNWLNKVCEFGLLVNAIEKKLNFFPKRD